MTLLQIENLFLIFLIYSFGGWLIESVGNLITKKKFVNRGFLLGPYCPIYGLGVVLITVLLSKYREDWIALFFLSAILCGTLEYFTSFIMEKIFKARWWDYSNMKYNINGRICLETLVLFAIAGIVILNFINPPIEKTLNLIPPLIHHILASILFLIIFIDFIISFKIMSSVKKIKISVSEQVKNNSNKLSNLNSDNTDEITTKVREILMQKSAPYRRILSAFPQAFADKLKESKEKIEKTAQKVKQDIDEVKTKAVDSLQEAKEKAIDNLQDAKEKTKLNIQEAKENTEKFLKNYKSNTKISLKKINRKNN